MGARGGQERSRRRRGPAERERDPLAERRPWAYPPDVAQAAHAAFHWRYRLIPYLYTMARVAHDTNLALCRPMYYEHPEEDAAYAARYQYYFGDQMIAAPIVHPADPATGLAAADVWVPAGTWIDYQTKESIAGPRWVRLVGDLNRLPMGALKYTYAIEELRGMVGLERRGKV